MEGIVLQSVFLTGLGALRGHFANAAAAARRAKRSRQHVADTGTMRQPLAIRLLLLLLSTTAGSAAVWLHSCSRRGFTGPDIACSKKSSAVLLPRLPRHTLAGLPYADVLEQRAPAATTATAGVRKPIQRSLQQQAVLISPRASLLSPSDAVAGAAALPAAPCDRHEAQEETDAELHSAVAAGDDLSLRSLLSRQLLVWGPEQQKVLPGSRVLLIGAGGAAVEAAKCLLQSGVGCVLLADPEEPSPQERAANFALAEHAEQQEVAASAAASSAEIDVAEAGGAGARSHPLRFPHGHRVGLSAQLLEAPEQQQQPTTRMTRAGIACASLRRVGAPYARVSEVSLHIQPGETAAAWRARVERVLQQVDVLLLCDRPLQQKLFYSAMARQLWSRRKEQQLRGQQQGGQERQQQQKPQPQRRKDGPLVVAVCTAGLTGRVAVDFGDFVFARVSEEAALTALLHKHAQPKRQQQQHHQQQQQQPYPKQAVEGQQSHGLPDPPDPQQQYLIAAFEALDAAETEGRRAGEEPERIPAADENTASPVTAAATTENSREADACAVAGSLRSWNASRLPAASLVAARAAAIWKRRYGPSAASAAAAAAAASARASHQSAAAVTAAAEAAAADAVSRGEAEAGRVGALMVRGSRGHLAPIAAAMGALAAQETLKGLTRKYRPLEGPFVLHALDLLRLTTQNQTEHDANRGGSDGRDGSSSNTRGCDRYPRAVSAGSSAGSRTSPAAATELGTGGAESGDTASLGASCAAGGGSRNASPRRVPWEGQQQLLGMELQRRLSHLRLMPWEGQQQLLGMELQRRLSHLRLLLVGAGAIGCEVLKNFALMGVSTDCRSSNRDNGCRSNGTTRCSQFRSSKERCIRLVRLLTTCLNAMRCSMSRHAGGRALGAAADAAAKEVCGDACLNAMRCSMLRHAGGRALGAAADAAAKEVCGDDCEGGLLSLIDGDTVETSNLSRQVLFTPESLQQPKATAAAAASLRFCSRTRLRPFPFMLSPETLWRLPPMYIQEQDLVVAALDSVEARLYVDALCLLHSKPWVEAGTLGLRGHSQSLVPYLTEHYAAAVRGGAVNASPTAQSLTAVPVCSVRGAPTAPLHAVHWASAQLQQTFKTDIAAAHILLQQLLQQQMQLPQRASAEQQTYGRVAPPRTAAAHSSTFDASDDVQAALRMLGMAPAAVAAAAAGPQRLRLLLRLAGEVLKAQRGTIRGHQASERLQQHHEHRGKHDEHGDSGDSGGEVSPLSATHLRLLSFAAFFFSVLFQKKAVEGPTQGNPTVAAPSAAHSANQRSTSILQQEQAEELLLQGKGLGPWSRQCVAKGLQRLLPKAACSEAGDSGLTGAGSEPTAVSLSALAEELVREVAATATAAAATAPTELDLRLFGAPAVLSLSADSAVPLRFLTSAARLRCRAFGLKPLPGPEETQQLIGRIVPATATATTLAAALACLEVYRLVAMGLAGAPSGQRMQRREQQQQQMQRGQIVKPTGRGSPVLWLDRGDRRNRQAAMKQQQHALRNSFFSLSVPFLAEAPPLPPPMHRFVIGRWRGQPFSPWHFFRLRLRGGGFSSSSHQHKGQGAVPGEAEAAETITISDLVELIEKDTRLRVLSLTCERTLLYAAPKDNDTLQQQQPEAVSRPQIAAMFGEHKPQKLPDPGTRLTEALRSALFAPNHSETQQDHQNQQKQRARRLQQQNKAPTWAVVLIAASDPLGAEVPLPALKVLVRPTV
ncbi:LOW QUALITY PROTEIN: ubiquitin-activating enzyme e1, putative [Eimeria mitis]|uniref:Ubiquitin-activating enzyme e1, putative n=1 Tax=Eimeria mitis TaxID=44415 RepID=U6JS80_9EIME|nr:LOW QUALITY PROTEIN: ubiquitin-activating enzyme e1, putative [Eimeria mitis]CDJ27676.1 ubiquitin-activating enzyme e1, putative [Eimeria mitis]